MDLVNSMLILTGEVMVVLEADTSCTILVAMLTVLALAAGPCELAAGP